MVTLQNPGSRIAKSMQFSDCWTSPNRFSNRYELECNYSSHSAPKICWLLKSYMICANAVKNHAASRLAFGIGKVLLAAYAAKEGIWAYQSTQARRTILPAAS